MCSLVTAAAEGIRCFTPTQNWSLTLWAAWKPPVLPLRVHIVNNRKANNTWRLAQVLPPLIRSKWSTSSNLPLEWLLCASTHFDGHTNSHALTLSVCDMWWRVKWRWDGRRTIRRTVTLLNPPVPLVHMLLALSVCKCCKFLLYFGYRVYIIMLWD